MGTDGGGYKREWKASAQSLKVELLLLVRQHLQRFAASQPLSFSVQESMELLLLAMFAAG